MRGRGAAPAGGLIVCHPPYGERVGAGETDALYEDLRRWLGEFRGWRAAFLVANPRFEEIMAVRPRVKKPLSASGLKGYFYLYECYATVRVPGHRDWPDRRPRGKLAPWTSSARSPPSSG